MFQPRKLSRPPKLQLLLQLLLPLSPRKPKLEVSKPCRQSPRRASDYPGRAHSCTFGFCTLRTLGLVENDIYPIDFEPFEPSLTTILPFSLPFFRLKIDQRKHGQLF